MRFPRQGPALIVAICGVVALVAGIAFALEPFTFGGHGQLELAVELSHSH